MAHVMDGIIYYIVQKCPYLTLIARACLGLGIINCHMYVCYCKSVMQTKKLQYQEIRCASNTLLFSQTIYNVFTINLSLSLVGRTNAICILLLLMYVLYIYINISISIFMHTYIFFFNLIPRKVMFQMISTKVSFSERLGFSENKPCAHKNSNCTEKRL
jgi:hypothetical protein